MRLGVIKVKSKDRVTVFEVDGTTEAEILRLVRKHSGKNAVIIEKRFIRGKRVNVDV